MDVFPHHARMGHTRPDDGAGRYQGLVVRATQLAQQAAHPRTLDVEATAGLGLEQLAAYQFVLLQHVDLVDVDVNATVAFHHLHRVADVSDAALAEDVDFDEADLFCRIHVVLRRREALGRQVEGGIIRNRVFRDQHAAGMDGTLAWEVAETRGEAEDAASEFALSGKSLGVAFHLVDFTLGQTEHLAQFAVEGVVLKGDRRPEQGHMLRAVFLKDMCDDLVAVAP